MKRHGLSEEDFEDKPSYYLEAFKLGCYYEIKRRSVTRGSYRVFVNRGQHIFSEPNFQMLCSAIIAMHKHGISVTKSSRFWKQFVAFAFRWSQSYNHRPFPFPAQLKSDILLDAFVKRTMSEPPPVQDDEVVVDIDQSYRKRIRDVWPKEYVDAICKMLDLPEE